MLLTLEPRPRPGGMPRRPRARVAPHLGRHLPGQLQHLVVHEEEAGHPMPGDEPQLLVQATLRLAERRPAVALVELLAAELRQPRIGGVALGDVRRGQPVTQVLGQVEAAALGDAEGVGHGLGPLGEALGLLGRATSGRTRGWAGVGCGSRRASCGGGWRTSTSWSRCRSGSW